MANMGYCRFENTYRDLLECYRNLGNSDLSGSEEKYRKKIIELCRDIVDETEFEDEE